MPKLLQQAWDGLASGGPVRYDKHDIKVVDILGHVMMLCTVLALKIEDTMIIAMTQVIKNDLLIFYMISCDCETKWLLLGASVHGLKVYICTYMI